MRASHIVIALCFACLGLELGLWGAMVPLISERLSLTPLDISLFLLLLGVSLVAAALFFPRLMRRYDSRKLVRLALPLYLGGFPLALLAPERSVFFIAAVWVGLACGLLDGGINLQAVEWERRARRKMLSTFHGMYTLGIMGGAGYWLLLRHVGATQLQALTPLLILVAILMFALSGRLLDDQGDTQEATEAGSIAGSALLELPLGLALFIGLLIFIATTVEGGMIDWSALFLSDELDIAPARAGVGVAVFAACMTLGRFCGDWLAHRISPIALLAWPMLLASLLLGLAVLSRSFTLSLAAFGVLGLAVANAFPLLLRLLAERLNARARVGAVARVIAFAYFGVISGPVALGLVAEHANYAATMLGVALLALLFALATGLFLSSFLSRTSDKSR